ncbi:amidase [Pendulispora rubella]|uniref:Amidase n=1 Tax=Pendulispora rubella TaxID=2741070 RepID=A0ABZ2KUE9_9BACT
MSTVQDLAFLAQLDATAQAELVARDELTAVELLDACEARISALEPLLNAIPILDKDRARAQSPGAGPFRGVPFLVKDVIPYPGLRWSLGSRLMAQNTAPFSTPFSARLDAAGLVTIGKSATSEFGLLGSTETMLEGVTHNPWDLARSAGGSSGGAVAAVAAGLVPIAHASDGGGSIRGPASMCGLFGFMPSRGRPVASGYASSDFTDFVLNHCVTRSVRDSALFLSLVEENAGAVGFVRGPSRRRLRIGAWTRTLCHGEPDPDVRHAHDRAVALVDELGHHVEEATPPAIDGAALGDAFFLIGGAMIADVVQTVERLRGQPVRRDELEPFAWWVAENALRGGPEALAKARATVAAAERTYVEATARYDVVLTPTLAVLPWRLGHFSSFVPGEELMRRMREAIGYTPIHNVVGCPAMSVPLHFTDGDIPVGAHFAAARGEDATLMALAYELEEARPWAARHAPFSCAKLLAS